MVRHLNHQIPIYHTNLFIELYKIRHFCLVGAENGGFYVNIRKTHNYEGCVLFLCAWAIKKIFLPFYLRDLNSCEDTLITLPIFPHIYKLRNVSFNNSSLFSFKRINPFSISRLKQLEVHPKALATFCIIFLGFCNAQIY